MKLELIKEIKTDGDIFYYVYTDGRYEAGTMVYGGHIEKNTPDELMERQIHAERMFHDYRNGLHMPTKEVILSEEITFKNQN